MEEKIIKRKAIIVALIIVVPIVLIVNIINIFEKKPTILNDKNVDAQSDFNMSILKLENNKQNMIYSPLSIKYALNMLNEGADGNTKIQLEKVLGNQQLTTYDNIPYVLSLANGIFIKNSFKNDVKEEYSSLLQTKYNAEINYDAFSDVTNVNNWIENKTLGIMKNVLNNNLLTEETKTILINALAINMQWKEQFDTTNTSPQKFTLDNGNIIKASTMKLSTNSNNVSYYIDENATTVSMNLKNWNSDCDLIPDLEYSENSQFEFIAIMPTIDLKTYIEKFSTKEYNDLVKKLIPASQNDKIIELTIPKFSYDYEAKLKEDLMSLGITDAFSTSKANFKKMSDTYLYVEEAIHKSKIEFTESGLKAAAVIIISNRNFGISDEPKFQKMKIEINKPFLYIIRDKKTSEILFIGTVYQPELWDDNKNNY